MNDGPELVGNADRQECSRDPARRLGSGLRLGHLGSEGEVARRAAVDVGADDGEAIGSSFDLVASGIGSGAEPRSLGDEGLAGPGRALASFARHRGHAVVPAEIEQRAQDRDAVAGASVQERRELALRQNDALGELIEVEADELANRFVELVLLACEHNRCAVVVQLLEA